MFDSLKKSFYALFVLSLCFYVQAVCLDGVLVSGGEAHTMVLTGDKTVWTCGLNGFKQPGRLGIIFL